MRNVIIIILGLFSGSAIGADSDFDQAKQFYSEGSYSLALKICRPEATNGNPDCQNFLGQMDQEGKGVNKNYIEAQKWFRRAAGRRGAGARGGGGRGDAEGRGGAVD